MHIAASDAYRAKRHPVALATVVAAHLAMGYALLTCLGVQVIPSAPRLIETTVLPDPPKPEPVVEQRLSEPAPLRPVIPVVLPPEIPVNPTESSITARQDTVVPQIVDVQRPAIPEASASTTPRVAAQAPVVDVTRCDQPEYPAAAARAEAVGTTRIAFAVDALGRVASAQVLHSAGPSREHKLLDRAAVDALGKCPFKAGIDESGRPVGGNATVEYAWTLN